MARLVLDRYEVLKSLAQGGMGEVLLARQTGVQGFERLVVLKSLRADLATDGGFIEQFLDEARVAATLNHPNIVNIFEVGEWDGAFYIVMEFIDGADLSRLWYASAKRGIGLPFQVTVKIIEDAARGLDHAHHARDVHGQLMNVVHRDVSPQNIMVRRDGVVKIVDFGIAKAKNRVSSTVVGTVKGKLQYMSPEQVKGEPVDGRSDEFSLGIVLWEMCTGKRLFKAENELATLNKVLHHAVQRPSTIVSGFPAELEGVLMRMLERERDARYPSCGAAAKDLARYLEHVHAHGRDMSVSAFIEDILGTELDERATELYRLTRAAPVRPRTQVSSPTPTPGAKRTSIRVATKDGTEIEFPHLDDVERAIREGRVGAYDILTVEGRSAIALGADDRFARLFASIVSQTPTARPTPPAHEAPAVVDPPFGPTSAWTPGRAPVSPTVTPARPTPTQVLDHVTRAPPALTRVDPREEFSDLELARELRRGWVRPMAIAAVVALLVTAGALLITDDALRARVFGTATGDTSSQLATTEAEDALRTHRPSALDAILATLEGDSVELVAWRARLHAARAAIEVERARLLALAGDDGGAQAAQARADQERINAYRAATSARASGEKVAAARLAMASYHALRGARAEVMLELKAAVDVETGDARARAERDGRILVALFETERALEALDDERAEALRVADDALAAATSGESVVEPRLAYARAALLVEHALLPTKKGAPVDAAMRASIERAQAALDALRPSLAGDERLTLLVARLATRTPTKASANAAPPAADPPPTTTATEGPVTGVPTEPTAASPVAPTSAPSPDELARDADRARERGSTWRAVGLYRKALAARPSFTRALIGLGWAYIDLSKNSDSIRTFERVRTLAPDESEAVFGLAEALRAAGETTRARAAYQKFIAMDPTNPDAAIAARALKSLPE
jgi:serine/threonine protein kinase/tetratricopeptide (TPR) repeat protein